MSTRTAPLFPYTTLFPSNGAELGERSHFFDAAAVRRLTDLSLAALERHGALLHARAAAGKVRLCPGAPHLRNVVLLDGRSSLFDTIEFEHALACTAVAYHLY